MTLYDKKMPIATVLQKLTHLETEIFGLPKKVIYPGEVHEAALGSVTRNASGASESSNAGEASFEERLAPRDPRWCPGS